MNTCSKQKQYKQCKNSPPRGSVRVTTRTQPCGSGSGLGLLPVFTMNLRRMNPRTSGPSDNWLCIIKSEPVLVDTEYQLMPLACWLVVWTHQLVTRSLLPTTKLILSVWSFYYLILSVWSFYYFHIWTHAYMSHFVEVYNVCVCVFIVVRYICLCVSLLYLGI